MSEFRVQEHGFQIVLDTGYIISVMFSTHHYCSNRHSFHTGQNRASVRHGENRDSVFGLRCTNAEVAVIDSDGEFISLEEKDDVLGYQSVSEVIALINKFNALET